MKIKTIIGLLLGVLIIWLTATFTNPSNVNHDINKESNEDVDVKELVEKYSSGVFNGKEIVFVDSESLTILNDDETKSVYPLPEDELYVSIAPFYELTHTCSIHYLTSCSSELSNEVFDILIKDINGTVIVDKTLQSQSNGFVDLWLPRDNQYTLKITHNENTVETSISTFSGDNTCITTPLKLN